MLHVEDIDQVCFWHIIFLTEDDTPSKLARVDIPTTPTGAVVPGSLGIAYRPQPALGTMQPM